VAVVLSFEQVSGSVIEAGNCCHQAQGFWTASMAKITAR
jgi:hypothetical protein